MATQKSSKQETAHESRKLVYLLNHYSDTDASHFNHIPHLLDVLGARGTQVTLVIEKADSAPVFSSANVHVILLKSRSGFMRLWELFLVLRSLINGGYTRTFIRISAPAAVIAALAHRLYGGSSWLWQSGTTLAFDAQQPLSLKKLRWYFASHLPARLARRAVSRFVTGPASMLDYYAEHAGVPRDKMRLLDNDVDLQRFHSPADRDRLRGEFLQARGFDPKSLVLLLVHRLSPVRCTDHYFPLCLEHLARQNLLDQVVVVVAGDGAQLAPIKSQAVYMGVADRCLFLGGVPNREVEALYAVADIFLHPTLNEGFPRVILEAMAAGLAVVSTDAGGTRELFGSRQAGLVTNKHSPQEFAVALAQLVEDAPLRQSLARENLDHVQRYATDTVAGMYEKVLFG